MELAISHDDDSTIVFSSHIKGVAYLVWSGVFEFLNFGACIVPPDKSL